VQPLDSQSPTASYPQQPVARLQGSGGGGELLDHGNVEMVSAPSRIRRTRWFDGAGRGGPLDNGPMPTDNAASEADLIRARKPCGR
jgi:hypothetical protein